jgi:kumamolisin
MNRNRARPFYTGLRTPPIQAFEDCYQVSPNIFPVNVDGGPGTGYGAGEATLDIETAMAMAPYASIRVYDAPPTASSLASYTSETIDELTQIMDDDWANVLSISYGVCEPVLLGYDAGFMQSENVLFEQAAIEGITVLASSGDSGSEGCGSLGFRAVQDPASQPFVTAVGGTTLTATGPPPVETTWNEGDGNDTYGFLNGASGGGVSVYWGMPSWQSEHGGINPYSDDPCGAATNGFCREVPDVSADADPAASPYITYWSGWPANATPKQPSPWGPSGGTSAATPLWAAMIADIETDSPIRQGFLNPTLYAAAPDGFNDITTGNNDWTSTFTPPTTRPHPATTSPRAWGHP